MNTVQEALVVALIAMMLPGMAAAACPPHDPLGDTMCLDYLLPTENIDGSPLTDLESLRVYYGFASRTYDGFLTVTDLNATSFVAEGGVISIPSPGPDGGDVTVFFAMTALDDDGNESVESSNEATRIKTFLDTLAPKSVILIIETQ